MKKCPKCGEEFVPKSYQHTYCTPRCQTSSWHRKRKRINSPCYKSNAKYADKFREIKRYVRKKCTMCDSECGAWCELRWIRNKVEEK